MSYANLTESQFKTFRADVQRAARGEIRDMAGHIRNEIHHGVISEVRRVATATARKDLQQMKSQIDALVNRVHNIEIAQTVDSDEREDITDSLEALEVRFNTLLTRLSSVESVESEAARKPLHRLILKDGTGYGGGIDPRLRTCSKYVTGDLYIAPDGERFWWYLGQWRRRSELEGFRDGLRACGLNP